MVEVKKKGRNSGEEIRGTTKENARQNSKEKIPAPSPRKVRKFSFLNTVLSSE